LSAGRLTVTGSGSVGGSMSSPIRRAGGCASGTLSTGPGWPGGVDEMSGRGGPDTADQSKSTGSGESVCSINGWLSVSAGAGAGVVVGAHGGTRNRFGEVSSSGSTDAAAVGSLTNSGAGTAGGMGAAGGTIGPVSRVRPTDLVTGADALIGGTRGAVGGA
jgi:hypothetical protein